MSIIGPRPGDVESKDAYIDKYEYGILICRKKNLNTVNEDMILNSGIIVERASLSEIFGENMRISKYIFNSYERERAYNDIIVNFPSNWLQLDVARDNMESDWYKDTDIQSRKEKIAELLAATGYIDKETVEMGLDAILNFEFHGQKIGVWLEDYAENPYGQGGEDDYEQRDDITDGLSGDREAVILYGLGFPEFDDALNYSTIKWNNNGLRTNKNDACTVDNFKTDLNGKDLIVIEEHGCTYGDEPLIVTEDEYDPESGEYQEDLDAERLSILITDEGAQYCLTPSFFEYYYSGGKLANSFVWIGSCYGASNSRLVDAFVNTGANAVVGHSDSVYTAYDYNMLNTVVDKMISGESL